MNSTQEIWVDIKNYEGCYQISNKGRVPFFNFFDGFRTSHELQKIQIWDYEDRKDMSDMDAVAAFRPKARLAAALRRRTIQTRAAIFGRSFQHRGFGKGLI